MTGSLLTPSGFDVAVHVTNLHLPEGQSHGRSPARERIQRRLAIDVNTHRLK